MPANLPTSEGQDRAVAAIVLTAGSVWRLWLAHTTFFNTDEAWHYYLANQASVWLAYKASLTISHPPLLILILHFWKALGTSNLILRLPSVIAGTVFCWIFYRWLDEVAGKASAWAGLILVTFLGPMIATSAEVRQNPLLLIFAMGAAWLLERALARESVRDMLASSLCLCLAMLSHYSAFFIAGALGIYAIVRIIQRMPLWRVVMVWLAGETAGVAVAAFLYKTHLGQLDHLLSQPLLPQQYLYSSYFHQGTDHLVPFLYRGTFGVFRFIFGETQIGQLAAVLFVAGIILLFFRRESGANVPSRPLGVLLLLPFFLNWLAAAAGEYPYGRMRQCMFLAIFALAGVSTCLSWMARERPIPAAAMAFGVVLLCLAFGTPQDRDVLPLADQRHEHMDAAIQFIRSEVAPSDAIFTDQATSYQLRHYLCSQKPVDIEDLGDGLSRFHCEGFKVYFSGPDDGALTADALSKRWHDGDGRFDLNELGARVWVVQGGWASGLGETLRTLPIFSQVEVHSFGRYLEVFQLPRPRPIATRTVESILHGD